MEKLFKSRIKKVSLAGCLFALSSSIAYSGTMGLEPLSTTGKFYVGVFGGGGALSSVDASQYGTAFDLSAGGPLAVNAFGRLEGNSTGFVGGQIGYEWPPLSLISPLWHFVPAVELEGYYVGETTLKGNEINNETTRLLEHDFYSEYPLKTGVFLVNMILNSNCSGLGKFHPYLGLGIGSAIVSISNATATQLSPPEPGLNHYNSDPNDRAFALALQPKIGLHYDLSPRTSLFVDYRFLYLSDTNYLFGSTVFPGHAATSPWQVKIKSQAYNFGTVGLHFDL